MQDFSCAMDSLNRLSAPMEEKTMTHMECIEVYSQLYRDAFGAPYIFNGGKDAAAVKRFVSNQISRDIFMEVIGYAMQQNGYPWNFATELATTVSKWSSLFAEYRKLNRPVQHRPVSRWSLVKQAEAIQQQIAVHPHNPQSINFNRTANPAIALSSLQEKLNEVTGQLAMS